MRHSRRKQSSVRKMFRRAARLQRAGLITEARQAEIEASLAASSLPRASQNTLLGEHRAAMRLAEVGAYAEHIPPIEIRDAGLRRRLPNQ